MEVRTRAETSSDLLDEPQGSWGAPVGFFVHETDDRQVVRLAPFDERTSHSGAVLGGSVLADFHFAFEMLDANLDTDDALQKLLAKGIGQKVGRPRFCFATFEVCRELPNADERIVAIHDDGAPTGMDGDVAHRGYFFRGHFVVARRDVRMGPLENDRDRTTVGVAPNLRRTCDMRDQRPEWTLPSLEDEGQVGDLRIAIHRDDQKAEAEIVDDRLEPLRLVSSEDSWVVHGTSLGSGLLRGFDEFEGETVARSALLGGLHGGRIPVAAVLGIA